MAWLKKAAAEFPLQRIERRNSDNPLHSVSAFEFDLGEAILGFNFIRPDGKQVRFPLFIHLAYLFRTKANAGSFRELAKLIQLLEEGEGSFSLLFICKVGGSFFPFLGRGEAFDKAPAPTPFILTALRELGFERSAESFGLVQNGTVLTRIFEASDPSPFSASLTVEDAMNRFSKHESDFGSFVRNLRETDENG